MVWVYAVILTLSAGFTSWALSHTADRLVAFLGLPSHIFNIISYVALSAIAFLMVASIPDAIAMCALLLWFIGTRHVTAPISFSIRATMGAILVVIAMSDLPAPQFALPEAMPDLAVMLFVCFLWVGVTLIPVGSPDRGVFTAYAASLGLFILGTLLMKLPNAIATDALVIAGALAGAFFSRRTYPMHDIWAGNAVLLFLLGFLAAQCAYAGLWWLGVLGIMPIMIYWLVRRV